MQTSWWALAQVGALCMALSMFGPQSLGPLEGFFSVCAAAPGDLRGKRRQSARAFAGMGLMMSLGMAWLLPPFAAPDEPYHWYRAVHVSSGHVLSVKQDQLLGDRLPAWAPELYEAIPASSLTRDARVSRAQWDSARAVGDRHGKRFMGFAATAMYPPTFYLPQAIALRAGRIANLSPMALFYVARMANAAAAWAIIAVALGGVGAVGAFWAPLLLLPVTLQQLSNLSPDACMVALTLALVALLVRAAWATGPQRDIFAKLSVAVGLLAQARPPLIALLLLFALPMLRRHAPKKPWRYPLGAALFAFPWFIGSLIWGVPLRTDLPSVADKAHIVLHDPIGFLQLLGRTTGAHADGYLWMMAGSLGWLDTAISPAAFFWAKCALVTGLVLSLGHKVPLSRADRVIVGFVLMGTYAAMQGVFYLTWTEPQSPVIQGFQGRYALMFLPLLPLLGGQLRLPATLRRAGAWLCMVASLRALAGVPWLLLERYYLH